MGAADSKQLRMAAQAIEEGIRKDDSGATYKVDLQGLQLTERDARTLAELIRHRKLHRLQTVRLGDCALTARALEHVTRSLCASAPYAQLVKVELVSSRDLPVCLCVCVCVGGGGGSEGVYGNHVCTRVFGFLQNPNRKP